MVESVKAASDVYAPVSGEVIEGNQAVADDPALVNSDPEGEGWFFKLKLDNPGELDGLMDEARLSRVGEDALSQAAVSTSKWDAADYARVGGFVAELGGAALDLLDPQPGERILDVGCGEGTLTEQDRRARRDGARHRQFARDGRGGAREGHRRAAARRGGHARSSPSSTRLSPTRRCTGCSTRSRRRGRSSAR